MIIAALKWSSAEKLAFSALLSDGRRATIPVGSGTWYDEAVLDAIGAGVVVGDPDPPPPPTKYEVDAAAAKAYPKLAALMAMSPAEVRAWVQANVTNLAQAQDAITTLAVAVSVIARNL